MDLAGKLQLKPGQSVAIVNQPEDARLDLGSDQPVRQVALDGVWSALRIRPA